MTTLTDRSGATVTGTLEIGSQVSSYTVSLEDGSTVGRVQFVDPPGTSQERIFFLTEVDQGYGGRARRSMKERTDAISHP